MNCNCDLPNNNSSYSESIGISESLLAINRRGSSHSGTSYLSGMSNSLLSSCSANSSYWNGSSTSSCNKLDETIRVDSFSEDRNSGFSKSASSDVVIRNKNSSMKSDDKSIEMKSRPRPSSMIMTPKKSVSHSKSTTSSSSQANNSLVNDIVLQALAVTTTASSALDGHGDGDGDIDNASTATTSTDKDDDNDDLVLLKLQKLLLEKEDLNLFRFDATCPTEKTTERRWSDISCVPAYSPSSNQFQTTMRGFDTSPTMPRRPSY